MSAHVSLNLSNESGKVDNIRGLPRLKSIIFIVMYTIKLPLKRNIWRENVDN